MRTIQLRENSVYQSPVRLLVILVITIFSTETCIMFFLHFRVVPSRIDSLLDSLVLSLVTFPVLYFFVFSPLNLYVSRIKRAEEELFESENRYHALVEGTSDWIWEVNEHGVFTYSSLQVREMLGYGAEEVLGKTPFDFMRPEEAGRVAEFFRATAATQKPFNSFWNLNLHKDGHEVAVETSGAPYFGADGRFIGYRGINRDITDRKRAEEELKRVYGELQEKSKYLERLNRQMVGRETRVLEMKKEVNDLLERLGEAKRYEWTAEEIK